MARPAAMPQTEEEVAALRASNGRLATELEAERGKTMAVVRSCNPGGSGPGCREIEPPLQAYRTGTGSNRYFISVVLLLSLKEKSK
jgi:hypothetical protein